MLNSQYPKTVGDAARLLDNARQGWYNEVDTTKLLKNPQSGLNSVLGQLWGGKEDSYNEARKELFGFYNIHISVFTPMIENINEWIREIEKRVIKKEI